MGLSLTVHHLDSGVYFIIIYVLLPRVFQAPHGSELVLAQGLCHLISVRLLFCPQAYFCPLTAVIPILSPTTSPTLPQLYATGTIFIRDFSSNKVNFLKS